MDCITTKLMFQNCWLGLFDLIVLAMESQAEALNQLTTDDLEGKVVFVLEDTFILLCLVRTIYISHLKMLFVCCSLQCSRAHQWMMISRKWKENYQEAPWYSRFFSDHMHYLYSVNFFKKYCFIYLCAIIYLIEPCNIIIFIEAFLKIIFYISSLAHLEKSLEIFLQKTYFPPWIGWLPKLR